MSYKFESAADWLFKKKWARYTVITLGGLFVLFSLFFFSIYFGMWGKLPSKEELASLDQSLATQIVDKNGKVYGKFFIFDRRPVEFKELPDHLIDALVATEDARFYDHDGIDKRSLLRVFFKTLVLQNESSGGGSTITQQLAKNLFGRNESSKVNLVVSKFKEFIIAQRLEEIHTKDEIINLYFNTVPFPDNTYGIESASQKFFGKPTEQLNLSEAAILVGSLKANTGLNPRLYPERSKTRRSVVLQQMIKYDRLESQDTIGMELDTVALNYQQYDDTGAVPFLRELIRQKAKVILDSINQNGKTIYNLYRDGLTIETTLDIKLQTYAENSMTEHLSQLQKTYERAWGNAAPWKRTSVLQPILESTSDYKKLAAQQLSEGALKDSLSRKRNRTIFDWEAGITEKSVTLSDSIENRLSQLQCGFVAIDPNDGSVLAYLGGIDFKHSQYDHVVQSKRQVGSTFKPFVYGAAIENGMDVCTYFPIADRTYIFDGKEWAPRNSGATEPDMMYSMKGGLSNSLNTVAAQIITKTGFDPVINFAKKMGINAKLPRVPSLALGTAGITVENLATAYLPFANGGKTIQPRYITRIKDRLGKIIYEAPRKNENQKPLSDFTQQAIIEMMRGTVNEGTATRLRSTYGLRNDIAGKTGTTQDNKDAWFVGLTPNLVAVTWVGNDDYRMGFSSTALGSGANAALPILAGLLKKVNADTTYRAIANSRFAVSPSVIQAMDCPMFKKDSTLTTSFIDDLFGIAQKRYSETVYLDSRGKITEIDRKEIDNDTIEDKKGGVFSFLKRKEKDAEN